MGDKLDILSLLDRDVTSKKSHYYSTCVYRDDLIKYLADEFGHDYFELMDPDEHEKRLIVNIHYFQKPQERVTKAHEQQGWFLDRGRRYVNVHLGGRSGIPAVAALH